MQIHVNEKLNVTITKTRNGLWDYIQIMSDDMVAVNVCLVAGSIEVNDRRQEGNESAKK